MEDDELNPLGLVWADLIGKRVLVGITTLDFHGNLRSQEQVHGRIDIADPKQGLLIELQGVGDGRKYSLPPDLRSFEYAPSGEYRLRSTGEVVTDPDFLVTWTVKQPDS